MNLLKLLFGQTDAREPEREAHRERRRHLKEEKGRRVPTHKRDRKRKNDKGPGIEKTAERVRRRLGKKI